MAEFQFLGGVRKPSIHLIEKFMLFFVVDGKEIPLYQLLRDGIVLRKNERGVEFITGMSVGKLFVYQSGFGIASRYHSFYFRFVDQPAEEVTIVPYSLGESGWYFRAPIKFLMKSEIAQILDDSEKSKQFVERQEPLPLETLRSMVTVAQVVYKDVRHVRIGKNK